MSQTVEFASPAWRALVREMIQEAHDANPAAYADTDFAFYEVFLDAPAHLGPGPDGAITWSVTARGGSLTFGTERLAEPTGANECDYAAIAPFSLEVFGEDPAHAAEVASQIDRLVAAGKVKIVGTRAEPPGFMDGLHDRLAWRTHLADGRTATAPAAP